MRTVALLLGLSLASTAAAGPLADGADAFEAGELDRAIDLWRPALDRGDPSGRLLFDLGNGWYRKGDLPRAIACYRAAQRLRPRDGNVHHNLALARSGLRGVPVPPGPSPAWTALLTSGELGVSGALATAAGSAAAVAWWRRRVAAWASLAAALVVVGLLATGLAWRAGASEVAVVVDQAAVLRDAPQPEAGTREALPPGCEVRLLDRAGDFLLVEDGRERRGWVPRNAVFAPGS